jgi:hypothetical protein
MGYSRQYQNGNLSMIRKAVNKFNFDERPVSMSGRRWRKKFVPCNQIKSYPY